MTAPQARWPRSANCTLIARTPCAPVRHDQGPGPATRLAWAFVVERVTRIELALSAWEADVLPLNYTRAGEHEDTGPPWGPVARPDIVPETTAASIARLAMTRAAGRTGRPPDRVSRLAYGRKVATTACQSVAGAGGGARARGPPPPAGVARGRRRRGAWRTPP